ncbi:MAG: hypothetical protein A3G18_05465 [Rhodospirillales bacterium RIFCSPLOWO2_12_FULL_58_28]|nr:MAG: hypothetical protein A3H92_05670 [Rhodospirillales bacterium RIFCSPLOWO2_02_FULL_58_16]OHC79402.1 MAG: hypothetical protein A3G18_05465 [Rhodospirillales bacterium RIFCSPLOWO2_12_FULL_58_28]
MKYREIGKTGIRVSEIGFGAWGIGGRTPGATSYGDADDDVSRSALKAALDEGITFFDTANVYGKSESLIGEAFAQCRSRVVISTKAGCVDYRAPLDLSPAAVIASLEGSLRRLGTDYVDMLMLHNPDPASDRLDDAFAALERLKSRGKIRAIGVSVREPGDCPVLLERFPVDAFQVNLNLMDQRALGVLGVVREAGCSIIARTPLCFGFLSDRLDGKAIFDESDHRSRWPEEQIMRWREGRRLFGQALPAPIAGAALRFCLSHDGVASVIPGIMTPEEVHENVKAAALGPLTEDDLTRAGDIYAGNTFFVKRPEAGPLLINLDAL